MNPPTHLLSVLVWLPAVAGIFVLFLPRQAPALLRLVGMGAALFEFGKSLQLLEGSDTQHGFRFVENAEWIPALGIRYHLAVDGLSLWLILLTTFLTPLTLYAAFGSVRAKQKELIAAFLLLESAMIGGFVSLDLFLFYVFWELMLVPMYLIIGIFGGPNRVYAGIKFFIYTFTCSVFMLLAILYMVVKFKMVDPAHHYSFDYEDLMRLGFSRGTELLLFFAFLVAFAVKVPLIPLHSWLPDAHTEAPTAGSVILAGVLLKLGTYGLLRFALPFFPTASHTVMPTLLWVPCIGIIYGSLVAWRQRDFKKLIAYSSIAHLGFVVLGIFSRTPRGVTGAVLQSVNHGISTGALFLLVGVLYDRRHTRDLAEFGGLAKVMPRYATFFVIVTMSSIGLPLTNGFVGEFLIITGTFSSDMLRMAYHCTQNPGGQRICDVAAIGPAFAIVAAIGVLLGAVYMLECVQRVFFGPLQNPKNQHLSDMNERETFAVLPLIALIFLIGIKPEIFTSRIEPDVTDWLAQYEQKRLAVGHVGAADATLLPSHTATVQGTGGAVPVVPIRPVPSDRPSPGSHGGGPADIRHVEPSR